MQLAASLKANNGAGTELSIVRSGNEKICHIGAVGVEEHDWDVDGVFAEAEAKGSGPCRRFRELQTESWAVHTEGIARLVNVVWMFKRSTTLREQLRDSDQELQEIIFSCEFPVVMYQGCNTLG